MLSKDILLLSRTIAGKYKKEGAGLGQSRGQQGHLVHFLLDSKRAALT